MVLTETEKCSTSLMFMNICLCTLECEACWTSNLIYHSLKISASLTGLAGKFSHLLYRYLKSEFLICKCVTLALHYINSVLGQSDITFEFLSCDIIINLLLKEHQKSYE